MRAATYSAPPSQARGLLWRALVLVLIWGSLLSACSAEHARVREKGRQQDAVLEVAKTYWHAVRWGYVDRAVVFVARPDEQGRLAEYMLARKELVTLDDVQVYHLALDEDLRGATVFVSYQIFSKNELRLNDRRIQQRWYYRDGRWYLELTPEELTRLE